jgi:thymidylate synthase
VRHKKSYFKDPSDKLQGVFKVWVGYNTPNLLRHVREASMRFKQNQPIRTFYVRGASEALFLGLQALNADGVKVETRNGVALEFDGPVCTTYTHPRERVLFYPVRDANPFFHLFESLWMLSGRNDVEWIDRYNGKIKQYSDDGKIFHGAYGYRWRKWFRFDQLERAIGRLETYPNDRRTVVTMWDPENDFKVSDYLVDVPCNTQIYFSARNGLLEMTVTNRSNDMIWGAYGANVVHMSILQEYVAARLELGVGKYHQFSNNLHAYVDVFDKMKDIPSDFDPYLTLADDGTAYTPPPLVDDHTTFDLELDIWVNEHHLQHDSEHYRISFNNSFFELTATPMRIAWDYWKKKDITEAITKAEIIEDRAWRKACVEWLTRRKELGIENETTST